VKPVAELKKPEAEIVIEKKQEENLEVKSLKHQE
jgi:hypothetical protein